MSETESGFRARASSHRSAATIALHELQERRKLLSERFLAQFDLWKNSGPHTESEEIEFRALHSEISVLTRQTREEQMSWTADMQEILNSKHLWKTASKLLIPGRRKQFKIQLRELDKRRSSGHLPTLTKATDRYEALLLTLESYAQGHQNPIVDMDTD